MGLRAIWRAGLAVALLAGSASALAATDHGGITDPVTCCEAAVRVAPPTTLPPPPSSNVVIVGDSLFAGIVWTSILGADTIQARLRATGRTVFANAQIGLTVPGGRQVVRHNGSIVAGADAAAIGLGTNEVVLAPSISVATARQAINDMVNELRAFSPGIRVVWVDVAVERARTATENWNQALADAAAEIPGFEVCAWRQHALANPGWYAGDGIHLDVAGYRARRDVVFNCLVVG